ncbi:hypothetical protein AB0N64_14565 [Microbacterium sp. NPDC089318]
MMPRTGLDVPGAAQDAWHALTGALDVTTPACRGDARFTADMLSPRDLGALRAVCDECPLFVMCAAFADAAPGWSMAGFWAGATRGHNTRADYKRREGAA